MDGTAAYAAPLAPHKSPHTADSITHIEALNVLVAVHNLVSPSDRGCHIIIFCDNITAVHILITGRGHEAGLLQLAYYPTTTYQAMTMA